MRLALLVVGLIFIAGYPLTIVWPSGWSWHAAQSDYLQMILGIYATLGVQALANSEHMGHLWGDVPALFVAAAVLALLTPRGAAAKQPE